MTIDNAIEVLIKQSADCHDMMMSCEDIFEFRTHMKYSVSFELGAEALRVVQDSHDGPAESLFKEFVNGLLDAQEDLMAESARFRELASSLADLCKDGELRDDGEVCELYGDEATSLLHDHIDWARELLGVPDRPDAYDEDEVNTSEAA